METREGSIVIDRIDLGDVGDNVYKEQLMLIRESMLIRE